MAVQCVQCGHCCSGALWLDANPLDVLREPRIAERGVLMDGQGTLPPDAWAWSLACGSPCPFLTDMHECEIYPTRPNECVCFTPGESRCSQGHVVHDPDVALEQWQEAIRQAVAVGVSPQ